MFLSLLESANVPVCNLTGQAFTNPLSLPPSLPPSLPSLDVKIPFYKQLGSLVKPTAIFGSNTSSLKISDFADPSGRPEKFVGLHFFNPVQLMRLVEIVKLDKTEEGAFKAVQEYVKRISKTAVTCKDTPGFIVNR